MKYIRKVLASLRRADEEFSLINKGDKILLGISGGKDSMALLKSMSIYGLFSHKNFKIIPAIIDLGFPGFDSQALQQYCKSLGYELLVDDSKFVFDALKANQKEGKHLPCSICSRMKKAAMTNLARRLGCNKVAFAHHKDDALETLFMNMIHGARVATFEPKMDLSQSGVTFIRPLIYSSEESLSKMCEEENIPIFPSHCPADKHTDRENIKKFLKEIYSKYPESERNFEEMLTNYDKFKLYFERIEYVNKYDDNLSFHPITNKDDVIAYYSLKEKNKELPKIKESKESYLILFKHKLIGLISFDVVNSHDIYIYSFDVIKKYNSKLELIFKDFIDKQIEKHNPVTFFYLAKNKTIAKAYGFKLFNNKLTYKFKI